MLRRVLWATLLFATACSPAASPAAPAAPNAPGTATKSSNQVLKISSTQMPASASPEVSSTFIYMYSNQFDSLVKFDKEFNILPSVAERWELTPDGMAWRFYLRKDLTFPNGDKLTAADVDFTVKTSIAGKTPQWALNPFLTDSKIVDDYTVDLLLSGRDISTLYNGPNWFIYPKKYYEQVGKNGFATKPMGSGPYDIVEFRANDSLVYKLRSEPHPFRKPTASEIRWKYVPEPATLIAGLRTGESDAAVGTFSPDQADQVKNAGLNVVTTESSLVAVLFDKNENERLQTPFLDKRVRLAMNYAVDKEAIARSLYKGYAKPTGQLASPGNPNFDPSIQPIPYDVAKAKALLAEAGYPNGFKVAGGMDFPINPFSESVYLAMQSYHKAIGVEYQLYPQEVGVYADIAFGRNGKTRKELVSAGTTNTNGVFTFSWGFLKCDKPKEQVIWCSEGLDRNMTLAFAEPDLQKRNAHLRAATKAWAEDMGMVFLVSAPAFVFISPKIQGFDWTTPTFYNFDSAYRTE